MTRPPLRLAWIPVAAGLLLLVPATVLGQQARGEVVQRASGAPVPGALVELRNASDSTVDRTVTDSKGTFLLRAPAPGIYRLRVERIGYRRWTSDPVELEAGASRSIRAEVPVQAIRLSDLDVSASRRCRTSPAVTRRTSQIWRETRKALASVRVTNRRGLLRFRIREYRRRADRQMDVIEERSREYVAVGRHPFEALSAADLSVEGYVRSVKVDGKTVTDYFAPNASALISDEFLADHCFRMAGREDGLVGLAFRPAEGRETPDIAGTFWLDPHTAQLRRVDFRYANIDLPAHRHRVGGGIEFVQLPEGPLIVRRWWIRMPRLGRGQLRLGDYVRFEDEAVTGYDVVGGRVLEVYGPQGDTLRTAETAALVGTVRRRETGEPVEDAQVRLTGTDRRTTTDEAGYFRLDLLIGGRYELAVHGPLARAAGLDPHVRSVELEAGSSRTLELGLPGRPALHERICPNGPSGAASPDHPLTAAVAGFVRDSTGEPVPDVVVDAGWDRSGNRGGDVAPDAGDRAERPSRRTRTDERGGYRLCHLPAGRPVQFGVHRDVPHAPGPGTEQTLDDGELRRLDLEVRADTGKTVDEPVGPGQGPESRGAP